MRWAMQKWYFDVRYMEQKRPESACASALSDHEPRCLL